MNKQTYCEISVLVIKINQNCCIACIACNLCNYLFNTVAFLLLEEEDIINEQNL